MNMIRKAACAVALIAATFLWIGCGNVYRPISTPLPVTNGSPSGPETEVVLNQCPLGPIGCHEGTTVYPSVLATIDVSGDTAGISGPLPIQVGSQFGPVAGSMASPMAFAFDRMSVFTANTANDSVTQLLLNPSSAGFSSTTTFFLPTGSAPIGISFQYFGSTYTQDYVVNSGTGTAICPGTGSLGVISQGTTDQLLATTCVGATPVFAWIYYDQSKVFVLDYSENQVYVVNASSPYQVLQKIPVGSGPIKAAQSNNGRYVYVLNSGNGTISIIDGQVDTVVNTVPASGQAVCANSTPPPAEILCDSPLIDIAQDPNFNDTSANTQKNHVWILHADAGCAELDHLDGHDHDGAGGCAHLCLSYEPGAAAGWHRGLRRRG
jgi:YVTN family beta-propeller protein